MLIAHGLHLGHASTLLGNLPDGASGAALVGLICASLQMIGPDHLCTLMAVSTTTTDWDAVRIGAAWGLAHCAGTVLVCVLLQTLRVWIVIDIETWEHYGDYCIGLSLIICAVYFTICESKYIVEEDDGSLKVLACGCCDNSTETAPEDSAAEMQPPPPPEAAFSSQRRLRRPYQSVVAGKLKCKNPDCDDVACIQRGETKPLLASGRQRDNLDWLGGAALGLLQGVCCPMVLVSVNCMAYVDTVLSLAVFLITYATLSFVGAALFSFAWARLMGKGSSFWSFCTPRHVYRASCAFTFIFGAGWIVLNRLNMLEQLNYTEAGLNTHFIKEMLAK